MDNVNKKIGRPQKKQYDEEKQFRNLLDTVDYIYDTTGEISATAIELDMSSVKVKKLLITSGKLEYKETKEIQRLISYGKKMSEIQEEMGLKKSSINSYLPYSKVPYKESEVSANADRCELYRKRKEAVEKIKDMDSLWSCIELFAGYTFKTITGLKYTYTVNGGEIFICRKEKSVTRASVEKAYRNISVKYGECRNSATPDDGLPVYSRPKDLGDVFGVSYIYPLFYRFGLIDVPEKAKKDMA